jgi:hypothetical protein
MRDAVKILTYRVNDRMVFVKCLNKTHKNGGGAPVAGRAGVTRPPRRLPAGSIDRRAEGGYIL